MRKVQGVLGALLGASITSARRAFGLRPKPDPYLANRPAYQEHDHFSNAGRNSPIDPSGSGDLSIEDTLTSIEGASDKPA